MRRYLILWLVLFVVTLGGWYLVGILEMGVADGTGIAPIWLRVLYGVEIALLLPIGWLALTLDPAIGYLRLGAFALFALIVAVNSAALTVAVWFVRERARAGPGRRGTTTDSPHQDPAQD